MAFTPAAKEAAALAVTALGSWISLHTADPGTTGASETSGGSPAYARKQTTWTGGASDGSVPGSQVSINAPAATFTFAGLWSAVTGGTYVGSAPISATLAAAGPLLVLPTVTVS